MKRFLSNNGLSVVLFGLFLVCWGGQSVVGWMHHNEEQRAHGAAPVEYPAYLVSGDFLEGTFENWESEFFQMAAFLILSASLVQRGSAESKKPKDEKERDGPDPREHVRPESPGPVHRGGLALGLYNHSLSLTLAALFLASFALHGVAGLKKVNDEARLHGEPTETLFAYMTSSTFWFESFQNWQSEFLSVGALVVLSVFLRQKGSPESKPVQAAHFETGA